MTEEKSKKQGQNQRWN